jgi:hypothetical protein
LAATLKSTGFQDAIDYKVIECSGIDDSTTQTNVTNSSGTLYGVVIESPNSSDNVSVHILNTVDTSLSQMTFKGKASSTKVYQIPKGYPFTELKFWVSKLSTANDTTSFAGSVTVRLICS